MKRLLLIGLVVLSTGCTSGSLAAIIEAAAKDQATVCLSANYGPATANYYRTNSPNVTVRCENGKMEVESLNK